MENGEAKAERPKRGGQPGNANARTHGLYAAASGTAFARELLALAGGQSIADALREDIDMMRVEMSRLVRGGQYDARALAALARAVAAHVAVLARAGGDQRDAVGDALDAVLADVRALAEGA